jgi:hypothetical protein
VFWFEFGVSEAETERAEAKATTMTTAATIKENRGLVICGRLQMGYRLFTTGHLSITETFWGSHGRMVF